MKRATLGVLLRELAMRADEEEEQQTALARDLSMGGVGASKKLAAAAKTISSQRAEIRDLKARLDAALALAGKHICPHEERHRGGVIWEFCDNCDAKWADDEGGFKPNPDAALLEAIADTKNKNWRKP